MSTSAESSGERSVAAAQSIRMALTGDGAAGTYVERALSLPAEVLELPACTSSVVNLPEKSGLFIGRERELALLDEAFKSTGGVVVQAVHGLGGIGKSTLAARWATGRTDDFNPVWWINAEAVSELDAGLAGLAVALKPALRDALSPEALRDLAVQWLASHEDWLLVLDNVSDPADVRALLGRAAKGGRYLITTRRRTGWHGIADPVPLDVLTLPEAVELFGEIYGGPAEGLADLCQELGCLPLAVEQAAAYCAEAGITAGEYRGLLARYPAEILGNAAEGGDSERTTARVWRLTLDRLADTPLAAQILLVIAWWAPEGIPRSYLESMGTPPEVTEAVRRLAAHSMIDLHDDGTISVHRLVQTVARTEDPDDPHRTPGVVGAARGFAIYLLIERGHRDSADWITHAEALAAHMHVEDETEAVAVLYTFIGLWHFGRYSDDRTAVWNAGALRIAERVCGPHHDTTRFMRCQVARVCRVSGEWTHAISLLRENLDASKRLHGRRSPETFQAHADLVSMMLATGDLKVGLPLAEKNTRKAERALGGDHPVTLESRVVLAQAWASLLLSNPAQYAARAVSEIERQRTRVLATVGEDEHSVDMLTWHLVHAREAKGDFAGALDLMEHLITVRSLYYGAANPLTLVTRSAQLHLLMRAGDLDQARRLGLALQADCQRFVGDCPLTHSIQQLLDGPLASPATPNSDSPAQPGA